MASSYSPLLRLELMATGEKSGLWGNVTNTNLSTILEQAIAGTVEISITGASSPITLTVANGASDQSRTAILRITGTNASPISIVAPATSKLYFVKNASNQPITIKTSTSTGVAVAVGDSRFIFYDTVTTDFALGPSSTVTGTVTSVAFSGGTTGLTVSGSPITSSGTITIGGTLAVTNGGTGAATATQAINNLLPSQAGQANKYLKTDGTNVSWSTAGAGTVTSVAVTTALSGITITGSPVTSSGTIAITGTLGIGSGGTGETTANAAFNALAPSQASNANKFLTTDGTNTSWASAVTSISVSGGTTGLAFSGSPITSSGTLLMSGVLEVTNGGTGASNASTAINNLLPLQTGNSGKVLSTNGSSVSWTAVSGGGGGTVTSVGFSAGSTGFSVTNSPITSSGTINLAGTLNITNGGTGATSDSGARANLSAAKSGANSDITSLTGLTTALSVGQGGTGATSDSGARSNLGLGTLATQNTVNLSSQVSGTLSTANGGTGSSSLTGAGIVTTSGDQSISGVKTFTTNLNVSAPTGINYLSGSFSLDGGLFLAPNSSITCLNFNNIGGSADPFKCGTVFSNRFFFNEPAGIQKWAGDSNAVAISASSADRYVGSVNGFFPAQDNIYILGSSTNRWAAVWAATGSIQTSDARQKTEVVESALGLDFIKSLRPVSYKWIVGGNEVKAKYPPESLPKDERNCVIEYPIDFGASTSTPVPGKRTHYGLIAQEVKQVLGDVDFGGYVYDSESDQHALRYDQFVAPLIKAVQELTHEVEALRARIAALESA